LELLQSQNKVLHRSGKPIKPPHDHDIELPASYRPQALVQLRTAILGSAHAVIDELTGDGPTSSGYVIPKFSKLNLGILFRS
jgi:hypothetical protein